jgi:isopenicillin-N N-acyltransferase like protein
MSAPRDIPHVRVGGEPFERGRQLGERAGDRIRRSIEIYDETFQHYTGLGWADIRRRAGVFVEPIEAYDPELVPEMRGIAEGAGVGFDDIVAINARTEIMYGLSVPIRPECTAFGARAPATAEDTVLVGQNWDWRPVTAETCILLEVEPDGRPAFITYVEAGLVAKTGFNAAGVGLMANLLITDRDRGEPGVPFHAILRGILTAPSFAHAVHAVTRASRAASANYLLGSEHGELTDLETGPGGSDTVAVIAAGDGVLCHANSFCEANGMTDLGLERLPDSPRRTDRMRELVADWHGRLDAAGAQELLADHAGHPASICRHTDDTEHPVERLATNGSIVADLGARALHLASGPPCSTPYEAITPGFASPAVRL